MTGDRPDPAISSLAAHRRAARPQRRLPPAFAELARLAGDIFQAPLASIVLTGWSESWYSAGVLPLSGLPDDPFLEHALSAADVFEVQDTETDRRLVGSDLALKAAGIRSYAGCAVRTAEGETLGALAIYRTTTRALSDHERRMLCAVARQGAALAELHARATELELLASNPPPSSTPPPDIPSRAFALADSLLDSAPTAIYYADTQSDLAYVNPEYRRMFRLAPSQCVHDWPRAVHPEDRARIAQAWADFLRRPRPTRLEYRALGDADAVRHYTEQVVPTEGISGYVGTISDITDLVNARRELVAASREAGMAEVASNVLHNVGNILNSVNISANLVTERIKHSKAPGVSRLATLLSQQPAGAARFLADDARGRQVPDYLAALGHRLLSDQREALKELALLRDNLEHIKEAVKMQQSYAKLRGVAQTVEVAALVEDSLRLDAGAPVRNGMRLERDFREVPPITVDRHKVLQILVNLVRNAKYACDESGRADQRITLRVEPSARGVRIAVVDNGVGIARENLQRLFCRGFTTRQSGHGFGLHSGALAAQELGGSLEAESAGKGLGAAFILDLPVEPPPAPAA